ncbi:hypothetical protein K503DRAFT_787407 [Rhizopogon vinicolor AM-OR11-026]|uniref:Uncharacterized protein n=1 Tax=Rhizopogon vinicolor AM-OR11-026 TaxID=1314800 RepID=A0A1B7MHP9_9AGAM|nr:hypothetical protein K503DRAFT_787407 [Rhizopogon vinicolor AM-OR11-026]
MSGEGVRSVGGDRLEIAAKRPFGMTSGKKILSSGRYATWPLTRIRYSENTADRESLNEIDETVQFLLWSSHKGLRPDIDHAIKSRAIGLDEKEVDDMVYSRGLLQNTRRSPLTQLSCFHIGVDVMLNSDRIEGKEWNNSDDHINLPVKLQIVVIWKGDETKANYLVKNRPIQAFGAYLPCLTLGPGGSIITLFTAHLSATSG